ncbi:MAG: pyridoxal phosphate-dependent aminotransferase [Deltaproteobacteria bacterium]|nr:MAG: pyridoxal phosphate-dependent aminotransferase [Deltaproteobacteria bacterium]
MTISKKVKRIMEESSWVRKMFETAAQLKVKYGEENIFDFTLGNPVEEPPAGLKEALKELALRPIPGMHRYMPNSGYPETRRFVAQQLCYQTSLPFTEDHIVMSVGAAGGMNIALKALLDEGDEVIVPSPYFVEFQFYIDNHGGLMRLVDTKEDFSLDLEAIEAAITDRTKVVLINSPNNPTGVVYSEGLLRELADLLKIKSKGRRTPIYLLADEAYKTIIYDDLSFPNIFEIYEPSISVTSYSKSLGVPGERIGYVAVNPLFPGAEEIMGALIFLNRTLGYINAPALMQRLIPLAGENHVGPREYQKKRDLLYQALIEYGYRVIRPQGAFYMFPQSPIEDDLSFVEDLQQDFHILTVPGRGFGKKGYFRISYCVETEVIERALPGFAAAARKYGLR